MKLQSTHEQVDLLIYLLLLVILPGKVYSINTRDYIYNPHISGSILNISITEPALIPVINTESKGIMFALPLSGSFEFSSSEFTLFNPASFLLYQDNWGNLISNLLFNSFDIEGLPPSEVSAVLTERLKNGVDFTFDTGISYFQYAKRDHPAISNSGFSFHLRSYSNAFLHVPGDAFKLIFSDHEGLQKGNNISLDHFNSKVEVVSDLSISYGRKTDGRLKLFKNKFDISWGVSTTYKIGHIMFDMETKDADINYSEDNVMSINSNAIIRSVGMRINDEFQLENTLASDGIFNGHGAEISAGLCLYSEKFLISLNLDNVGFMAWNSKIHKQNISFYDDSLFLLDIEAQSPEEILTIEGSSTGKVSADPLNTSMSIKFSLYQKLKNRNSNILKMLSASRAVSAGYVQPFFKDYFNKRSPLFFLVLENELINGRFPFRVGWDYQNRQNCSSFIEIEQVDKGLTFSLWYRARYDMLFRCRKGGEIGLRSHIYL